MLVLARKKLEKIIITVGNRQVIITVTEIRGDRVRLGFDADRDIAIDRREVLDRQRCEK